MNTAQRMMVEDAKKQKRRLTAWEVNFIAKMDGLPPEQVLSAKQSASLRDIIEKLKRL
jgi:hypothetical protein